MPLQNRNTISAISDWLNPKDQERNLVSAGLHMINIALISMSLVGINWFSLSADVCTPYLPITIFFWFGYSDEDVGYPGYACFTPTMVNVMRIIILLCFMAIIFSLGGFFLDVLGPKSYFYRCIRKYAIPNICLVLWVMAIISVSYYVVVLLEDSLDQLYPSAKTTVTYGPGFYIIAASGAISLINIFYVLIMTNNSVDPYMTENRCLIDESTFDDTMDTFNGVPPPPPYNVPPPPYTP